MVEGQNAADGNSARARLGIKIPLTVENRNPHSAGFNPVGYGLDVPGLPPQSGVIPKRTLISGDRGGITERAREQNTKMISHGLGKESHAGTFGSGGHK